MRKLLIWWDVQVFGKSDRASGPVPPSDDVENLSTFVERWHVESDSDDDDLGMLPLKLHLKFTNVAL